MSDVITLQPNLSMRYSAGKLSKEDLIKPDNDTDYREPDTNDANNGEGRENPEAGANEEPAKGYYNNEETFCDYMASICHCTSWLCANLISSVVLCFENCIDFVHTCKCNRFCCDVCGGSEDDQEDRHEVTDERNNDLSGTSEDEYIVCEYVLDNEEDLPDSCVVVERNKMSDADREKIKDMSNNENKTEDSADKKKSWL